MELVNLRKDQLKVLNLNNRDKTDRKTNEQNLGNPWDNNKRCTICIIGVLEREEKQSGTKRVLEKITAENFSNLTKDTNLQMQDNERTQTEVTQINL